MAHRQQRAGIGPASAEWRTGWTLVLAASVGFSFFSVMMGAIGLFIEPLSKAFGWSRTLVSAGPSIATATTAILAPAVGVLIDRFGSRPIVLPGIVLTIVAIAAFSLTNGSPAQWIALWCAFGVVATLIKSTAWTAAVVGYFEKSRGLALGLTLSGTAVAQSVVPPLCNWLMMEFGWRGAFVWLAVGWGGVTFLLCLLLFVDPRRRHGQAAAETVRDDAKPDLPGLSVRDALRNSALWRVAISNFIVMLLTIGLAIHLFAILTEAGIDRTSAAWLTGLGGIAGILGKLASGFLLDRYRPNLIGGVTLAVAAIAFLLLMEGIRSPALIIVAMLVNGYAAGTKIQIVGYLTAGYAGMRNFGAIYGTMSALLALASGLGPMLAGFIYDRSGSYSPFLAAGAAGCVLGGLLIMSLPRYPDWGTDEKDPSDDRPNAGGAQTRPA